MSEETNQPHFSMQKIYLKKNLFTSPNSASVFGTDWKPETTLDLNITNTAIDSDGRYEVIVTVKVTATNENIVAFTHEVDQAALFLISGFSDERLDEALHSACPLIMFPYLRETLDNVLLKAGYPPMMLAPINFDAMYKEKQTAKKAKEALEKEKKH
jgi:preprotein translocase subunit SecB